MKDTGIVRHIDDLGRIVIPIEIRKRFGIEKRDPLEIYVKGDRIVLGKLQEGCTFCGRTRGLVEHYGRPVCSTCRTELATETAAS
jgi:AbrB family transcriptional regulator, transcriptional pleiotropic regulator of transition state genes